MVAAPQPARESAWAGVRRFAIVSGILLLAVGAVFVYRTERNYRERMKHLRAKYGPGLSDHEMIVRDVQGR
jgi:hypothetical protein